jgi:hypothetical protein
MGRRFRQPLAAAVWLALFSLLLLRVAFLNDHFDRISRGRQILAYGETPFADFRDPGYFLTLYVSAAAQWLTGGGLLGEAIVTSAAIATAGTLAFLLASAASGSLAVGLLAPLLMLLEPPRYYDYDKVLFYMGGLAACWRYLDLPTRKRLVAAAIITAVAALFRYDNGLYVFVACVVAIAIRRARDRANLASDLFFYFGVVFLAALPASLFVQATAGLPEAIRQIAAYAATEGHRSELLELPELGFDRVSITYALIVVTAPIALFHLAWRSKASRSMLTYADAKIAAAATLLVCVCVFVLRDPISARLGAAVPVAFVLAASIVGYWRRRRATASSRRLSPAFGTATMLIAVAVSLAAVAVPQAWRVARAPFSVTRRLIAMSSELRDSPPRTEYFPDGAALSGLAEYLRACTPPGSRVLLTWFAPEVYFFAGRGFAGGMAVVLGSHWSSEDDQRRTIAQLESQSVPLVIVQTESEASFRANFPLVAADVDRNYRVASTTRFGDRRVSGGGYRVLIRRDIDEGKSPREPTACQGTPE